MGAFENHRSLAAAVTATPRVSITNVLVWLAAALGVTSAVPGLGLGVFGVPLGAAAAVASATALVRLNNKPPEERRGEVLALVSLGLGVFQVVFALVAFVFVNLD